MPTTDEIDRADHLRVGHPLPQRRASLAERLGLPDHPDTIDNIWLFEALQNDQFVGGLCVRPQPGATALFETPQTLLSTNPENARSIATALLLAATSELSPANIRLGQALLDPESQPDTMPWCNAGFAHAADLAYLAAGEDDFPSIAPSDGLQFEPFHESQVARLTRLIEQTYRGSLDCPALDGVRHLDDVLRGYRAIGLYEPANWFFARQANKDVGCLLLTSHPTSGEVADSPLELVYMGIVPAARGRGWGRCLVREAQWHARRLGRRRVVLAVDAANQPAVRTYAECGFVAWAMRAVWLKFVESAT